MTSMTKQTTRRSLLAAMACLPLSTLAAGDQGTRLNGSVPHPSDFGAAGNGLADDTEALRAWARHPAAIHDLGDDSCVYLVACPAGADTIIPLASGCRINGRGATIKVSDNSPAFHAIMGSINLADDLSDTAIEGVVFDHNSARQKFSAANNLLLKPHFTFAAKRGRAIIFRSNIVKNAVCTNSVFLNGDNGEGNNYVQAPVISGNRWENVGSLAAPAHDHSTIYTNDIDGSVFDNHGTAVAPNASGTTCFIETHGTGTTVHDNTAADFLGFANISGIRGAGDTERVTVFNNKARTIQFGVRLFSMTAGHHTTGYGLNGVDVHNNEMRIMQTMLKAGRSAFYGGIFIQPGTTLPVKNVRLRDNRVTYDEETRPSAYSAVALAIGCGETSGTQIFENIEISGNTVTNSPAFAIALGFGGGVFKDCIIGANTLINPGSGLNPSVSNSAYRCALSLRGNRYVGSLTVRRQTIIDTHETTRLTAGVYAAPVTDSTACRFTLDLDVQLEGAKTEAFVRAYASGNGNLRPSLQTQVRKVGSRLR